MSYDLEIIKKNQEYMRKLKEKDKIEREEKIKAEHEKLGFAYPSKEKDFHGDGDHPSTMENGTATLLYVITMCVGLIFVDRWLIWAVASFIYFNFINRHKKR